MDQTRLPADDLAAQWPTARVPSEPMDLPDPATDPVLAAALAESVAQHERALLDDPIPALAGHTPRQCTEDPTRRPDLIALLGSFPEDNGQPGAMSPARLRAALGLG